MRALAGLPALLVAMAAASGCGDDAEAVKPATPAVVGCAEQSGARFPAAYTTPGNLVVGPLAIIGGVGAGALTPNEINRYGRGWWKMPVLVRAGHKVTITIRPSGRRDARLAYTHPADGRRATIRNTPYDEMTFTACSGRRSQSSADGRPVTFWSGGFVYRKLPVCIPLKIAIDGRAPVQRSLSLADPGCPPRA